MLCLEGRGAGLAVPFVMCAAPSEPKSAVAPHYAPSEDRWRNAMPMCAPPLPLAHLRRYSRSRSRSRRRLSSLPASAAQRPLGAAKKARRRAASVFTDGAPGWGLVSCERRCLMRHAPGGC